ncbi:50S ribosomal protein L3 [Neisseria meningitidis]|nr:50S ribosomal protein L3 [Neisseria meningitidis]
MTLGLVGRKVGMTRVFDEQGVSVPVTVLDMSAKPRYTSKIQRY